MHQRFIRNDPPARQHPSTRTPRSSSWLLASRERLTAVRYSAVSAISIAISQAVLVVAFGWGHLPARTSNLLACIVATGPSYYLNRTWAWGKLGKSSLWREIVPFWALALLGLAFSTWTTDFADSLAQRSHAPQPAATAIVALASLAAFGTLWIGKFVFFNAVLFADRRHERGAGPSSSVLAAKPALRVTHRTAASDPLRVPHA
jgi:putative flippase GtrA